MGTRGRKSHESLSVAPVVELRPLPKPPAHLTQDQADIWRMVIASRGGDLIPQESYPVLVEYCRAVCISNEISDELREFKPEWRKTDEGLRRWKTLTQMSRDHGMLVASLSVKLRLSPSTRILPDRAGVNQMKGQKRKPWELDQDET